MGPRVLTGGRAPRPGRVIRSCPAFPRGRPFGGRDRGESAPADAERANRAVLVVEDERDLRESFKDVLELEGYRVFLAENGLRALEALPRIPRPAVIMLDLMMPVMNGCEFLAALRGGEHRDLPVIVVSAFADRAAGLDVEVVLEKPFRPGDLYGILERVQRPVNP